MFLQEGMGHTYSFEKLEVWQRSRVLVKMVYQNTRHYPSSETYGLTSQLRRAAVSICTNLAEGSARKTAKDQANFSTMAYSSLMEVLTLTLISNDLEYIDNQQLSDLRELIEELSNKINALRRSQSNGNK